VISNAKRYKVVGYHRCEIFNINDLEWGVRVLIPKKQLVRKKYGNGSKIERNHFTDGGCEGHYNILPKS
jgi:hypothetical protein